MMSQDVLISNGDFYIKGRKISLLSPVAQMIPISEMFVLRLVVPVGIINNSNILAVGKDGEQIWIIEPTPHGGTENSPYVDVHLTKEGKIVARNWNGVEYEVDLVTGKINVVNFRRF